MSHLDPGLGALYSRAVNSIADLDVVLSNTIHPLEEVTPILKEASCLPFKHGIDSVAMRWVLYQEAVAMFLQDPWIGVGAAAFGKYSCAGIGGFPHSTALQILAELGILGAGLFAILVVLVFHQVDQKNAAFKRYTRIARYKFLFCTFRDCGASRPNLWELFYVSVNLFTYRHCGEYARERKTKR